MDNVRQFPISPRSQAPLGNAGLEALLRVGVWTRLEAELLDRHSQAELGNEGCRFYPEISTPMIRTLLVSGCLFALCASTHADDWQPAKGPLMTKWAKDVSPAKVHPEYPRPQMVRKDWMNLNGLWQ